MNTHFSRACCKIPNIRWVGAAEAPCQSMARVDSYRTPDAMRDVHAPGGSVGVLFSLFCRFVD